MKYAYRFGATTFDSFNYYLKSEKPDALQDFLNNLNRVRTSNAAARRGTAFNDLIDLAGAGKIRLSDIPLRDGILFYTAILDGIKETQEFPLEIVVKYIKMYEHAVSQVFVTAPFETQHGTVELYGYVDKVLQDRAEDIKTCREYEFGKYRNNFQHHVYPYCLNFMGNHINEFVYTPTDFKDVYDEAYAYYPEKTREKLTIACNQLIEFCEIFKDQITNPKIFGGELIKT